MVLHKMVNIDPDMNKNDFLKEIDSIQRFVEDVRCEVAPDKNQLDIANARATSTCFSLLLLILFNFSIRLNY